MRKQEDGTVERRESKGLAIAAEVKPHRDTNVWIVPSQSSGKSYTVDLKAEPPSCTCPDYADHRRECKHIFAAMYAVRREGGETLPNAPKIVRPTYPQQWHEYNLSQTREKAYFIELLYQLCSLVEKPEKPRGKGRPPAPFADLIFGACLKVYGCVSGRRNQTDLDEALRRGYLSRRVRYNTLFKYLELESLTDYLQQLITESSLALKSVEVDFALDSSGFGTCQYVRWFDMKHRGTEDWHDWIKLHVMVGVKSNIVTSVEVSCRYSNDSPYFKPLVDRTARNFQLREISADKGYDSFSNRCHALTKGAIPYIPYRDFTQKHRIYKGELWQRMYHFYKYNAAEFNQHYHKRSNAESTFQMIKARFGERLRFKTERAQINEALVKVLCHNICVVIQSMHELGIEADFIGKDEVCLQNEPI
jgi:transposase